MTRTSGLLLRIASLFLVVLSPAALAMSVPSDPTSTGSGPAESESVEAMAVTPPTADDIVAIEHLFGFDEAMAGVVDRAIATAREARNFDKAQRACVKEVATPLFGSAIDEAFAKVFFRHEYIVSWVEFADTGSGRKFVAYLKQGVLAISTGQAPPSKADLQNLFDATERAELSAFLHTPAGLAFGNGMKNVALAFSPDLIAKAESQTKQRCGVTLDTPSTDAPASPASVTP